MIQVSSIRQMAEEYLQGTDRFLVEVTVKPGNRILVFIDSDSFVSIDHCAGLNRYIESQLDRETEDFELSVYSAGLDQPLKMLRQYTRLLGHEVSVTLKDGKKITGILESADDRHIEVKAAVKVKKEITETLYKLGLDEIKETKQVIKF